jgi:hypothetical protein
MYLTNKYSTWYYNIIDRANSRTLTGYTEKHHIIPKSLGGSNAEENLATLTPREHFICHLLLTKMTEGRNKQKMVFGLWRMAVPTNKRYRITSRSYDKIREQFCETNSIRHKGKKNSQEALDKRRATMMERYGTMRTFSAGDHSAETKERIGRKNSGRKDSSETLLKKKLSHQGSKNWCAKLTDKQVISIKLSDKSSLDLAREYDISRSLVYKIKDGSAWSHISVQNIR